MGKTNKANRTKGNTRPSSSGHSAQLLSGRQLSGFIGFDALEKETASYVPVTGQQVSDSPGSSVDSDFRMVMRKMLKRDAVTRLKAMQSFGDYCMQKDTNVVKNVLPFWPRLFNKLALDSDRRIREATHQSNDKLFAKVKREMAPYLKHIMGVWLLGQCDLYAPAASSAQNAFSCNFQPAKQSEALLFCKNEIFSYFKDNLFEQTAKSMSEPNSTTPEDMENKYILVISATLQALKFFLMTANCKDNADVKDEFRQIIAEDKFWKFAKHKEPQIRASWFALVSSVCNIIPMIFDDVKKKLATTVFSSLSESNPVVARSVWDSALSIAVSFENCWEGLNIHKVALPHVWSLLIKGGKGNAHLLFPCLLPLLSKLPKEVLESEEFHLQFFPSFKKSLMLDTVKSSLSECDAILVSFFECLQYVSFTRLKSMNAGQALLENILVNEVVSLVETALYDPKGSHLAISDLFPLLASFIRKMEAESLNNQEETSEVLLNTLTTFWSALHQVMKNFFNLPEEKKDTALVYVSFFYNCLLNPSDSSKKSKKRTVRFTEEGASENAPLKENLPVLDGMPLSDKNTRSFHAIGDFCALLCEKITTNCQLKYLKLLEEILSSATRSDLIIELMKVFSESYNYEADSAFGFFQNVILKWVEESDNDGRKLNSIFNSVFVICSHIPEDEAFKILNSCCKISVVLLEQVLKIGLKAYAVMPFFQTWLKTSLWTTEIVSGLEELVCGKKFFCDSSAKVPICIYYRILTLCLSERKPLIDDVTFEAIIQLLHTLSEQLISMEVNYDIELALDFIHDVTIAILQNPQTCWKFDAMSDLIFLLFRINKNYVNNFRKASVVNQMLIQILNAFVDSYIKTKEEIMNNSSLIFKMATELNSSIQMMKTDHESDHVLSQCLFLISSVEKAVARHKPELNSTLFISYKLLDEMLPKEDYWNSLKEGLQINILPWILKERIFYPLLTTEEFSSDEKQVLKYTLVSYVISNILNSVISKSEVEEEYKKFSVHYIRKHLMYLLWFLTFCKGNGIKQEIKRIVKKNCLKMLSFLPDADTNELAMDIHKLSLNDENWALCLQFLAGIYEQIDLESLSGNMFADSFSLSAKSMMNRYVIRQIVIPYLTSEDIKNHVQQLLLDLDCTRYDVNDENFYGKIAELCVCLKCCGNKLPKETKILIKIAWLDKFYLSFNKWYSYGLEDSTKLNLQNMQISIALAILENDFDLFYNDTMVYFMALFSTLIQGVKRGAFKTPKEVLLLNQTINLFIALSKILDWVEKDEDCTWKTVLASRKDICEEMVILFIYVATHLPEEKVEVLEIVLNNLLKAVEYIPGENLVNLLVAQEVTKEEKKEKDLVSSTLITKLTSNVRQLQFASHSLLLKAMPFLPKIVAEEVQLKSENETDDEEIETPKSLSPLISMLIFANEIVNSMLIDIKIGDLCAVVPHTDSYVYSTAYLFAWMELFEFFAASPSQVRLGYALYLEEKANLLSSLFSNLFRLMPENPILCLKKGLKLESPKKEDLKLLFIHLPKLPDHPSSEEIQMLACYVYASALRKVPAAVRTWWNNLDRKSADLVNSFTTKYVSGLLCMEEIQAVHENEKEFENLAVQARPGSREVSATYTIDDCKIELCIQLPINYPLGPITSERRGKVVVGQQEWRHWLMQLTTVLAYQNGSIVDGLHIWKKNLDKKFEGVEECMICYYILHSSTLKLPKLSCHVCRKKFHSACLYKWFRTSNNSTCPLCRNEFAMQY